MEAVPRGGFLFFAFVTRRARMRNKRQHPFLFVIKQYIPLFFDQAENHIIHILGSVKMRVTSREKPNGGAPSQT
jgi:hypothetical protein